MTINPTSLQKYDYPNDMIMSLVEAAENSCSHVEQDSIYVSYQEDNEAWIICDNYDRGMFNAILCYDNGNFRIWDVDQFKEFTYVNNFNGNRITSYEAAYQHAKQFFTINSTSQLKGKKLLE